MGISWAADCILEKNFESFKRYYRLKADIKDAALFADFFECSGKVLVFSILYHKI
jgi:hypothetical protein